jgi:hypothetical protein
MKYIIIPILSVIGRFLWIIFRVFFAYPIDFVSTVLNVVILCIWNFNFNSLSMFKDIGKEPFYSNGWCATHNNPPYKRYWKYETLLDCIQNKKTYAIKQ